MSKGSKRRPQVVSSEEMADRWERAFETKEPTATPDWPAPEWVCLGCGGTSEDDKCICDEETADGCPICGDADCQAEDSFDCMFGEDEDD